MAVSLTDSSFIFRIIFPEDTHLLVSQACWHLLFEVHYLFLLLSLLSFLRTVILLFHGCFHSNYLLLLVYLHPFLLCRLKLANRHYTEIFSIINTVLGLIQRMNRQAWKWCSGVYVLRCLSLKHLTLHPTEEMHDKMWEGQTLDSFKNSQLY